MVNHDYEILERIGEIMDDNELEIQKAISMVRLSVRQDEAFSTVVENITKVNNLLKEINDEMARAVGINMALEFITLLEDKLEQI